MQTYPGPFIREMFAMGLIHESLKIVEKGRGYSIRQIRKVLQLFEESTN